MSVNNKEEIVVIHAPHSWERVTTSGRSSKTIITVGYRLPVSCIVSFRFSTIVNELHFSLTNTILLLFPT